MIIYFTIFIQYKQLTLERAKKVLTINFEQNVTTEKYEDFDGERWVVLGEQ